MGYPPVRKIIHSLKLVDYLNVQADNPWYNEYIDACKLTLKASFTTAADDRIYYIFPTFRKKIRYDIS